MHGARFRHLILLAHTLLLTGLLAGGCATRTDVITTDFTRQAGLYVVAYVERPEIRVQLEDQFVADLAAQGMRGVASRHDFSNIKSVQPADMVRAANQHQVVAIVIINRVARDGSGSIIQSDRRATPNDPDIHAYYESTKDELDNYGQDDPVFAEVNAFYVDGTKTRRFWSGSTWTFNEGNETQAITAISQTIAAEMAKVRDGIRSYSRPMN